MNGYYINPFPDIYLNLSGGTVTGGTNFTAGLSASTFFSGSTDLYDIFASAGSGDITRVQSGLNTYTGGTANLPTVNVSAATLDTLTVTGNTILCATTINGLLTANQVNINAPGSLLFSFSIQGVDNNIVTYRDVDGEDVFIFQGSLANSDLDIGIGDYSEAYGLPGYRIEFNKALHHFKGGNVFIGDGSLVPNEKLYVDGNTRINGILSANTIYSGSTNLYDIFSTTSGVNLTPSLIAYAGSSGFLTGETGFVYNDSTNVFTSPNMATAIDGSLIVGSGGTVIGYGGAHGVAGVGDLTVHGNFVIFGDTFSAHTEQMYIEDNLITLNFNPTGSTAASSLGSGFEVQDGSGIQGTDVFWDIRGTGDTLSERSFTTNLYEIRVQESGTVNSPNGLRVLVEGDIISGGEF